MATERHVVLMGTAGSGKSQLLLDAALLHESVRERHVREYHALADLPRDVVRQIRDVVRDELEQQRLDEEVFGKPRPKPKTQRKRPLTYPEKNEFEKKLREVIDKIVEGWDRLTVDRVTRDMLLGSRNTLENHFQRHGYKLRGETTKQTLERLADTWNPGWRSRQP